MKSFDPSYYQAHWNYPTAVRVGPGTLAGVVQECIARGMQRPLLVTDPGIAALPMTDTLLRSLADGGLGAVMFSDVRGNPTGENVDYGVTAFRAGNHDGVIALGGGSALDAGKTIALVAGQNRPVFDFVDEGDNWRRVEADAVAPIVAIPTTAGTGSEVGRAAVITHTAERCKKIIFHPKMLPGLVVLDPELTVGLPRHLTAATGMDALSHNLEALCAPGYHPMASGIAVEGIRLVREYLPRACADGGDLEARTQMLVASSMGATAFQRGLGAMHALSHSLGALYDSHHGLLNAIVMPYVLRANQDVIAEPLTRAARYLDLPVHSPAAFLDWVLELRAQLDIAPTLGDTGIDTEDAALVGEMAERDPTAATNPVRFTAQQYSDLFVRAVEGDL